MLEFRSGTIRAVNAERAILEALEQAYGTDQPECSLLLINAVVGHDLLALSAVAARQCPQARILAASCAGVVGREGPGESMHDIAVMGITGEGCSVAQVDGLLGPTSFEKGAELARGLQEAAPQPVRMLYLLASGIDIANDRLIAGIESVLGPEVVIFGATSSDQMQGVSTHQAIDGVLYQHAAFAVGIWDPSLAVITQASHGFVAVGEPLWVSEARGNRIVRINGQPAWSAYLERLGLPADASEADTIPIGALAELLPAELTADYGNDHILRVVTHHTAAGEIIYATECAAGTSLRLTVRDEERIFADMDRMLAAMTAAAPPGPPVAVFHADCLARGRRLFNRVIKEELVHRMQQPFLDQGQVPPWFGMYGFGEYAQLGGSNAYHNYTTALAALYRVDPA
ncbi:FIST signal transduction protein [Synechococcus sp. CS-1328]|uniref:FIST signal transduction protein n=1 Tax=Synechococcus sp. CS-1328 TaxID=2847976 RepID=UPI00223B9C0B|nr:FIST N-terminal domain-containing protein [Synechococcus sp. CS-1328]MCT0224489.1 FIST C-terminal domain-containing protein [Synechococcus sp. CS-1328]